MHINQLESLNSFPSPTFNPEKFLKAVGSIQGKEKKRFSSPNTSDARIAIIAPFLPHPAELNLLELACQTLNVQANLYTRKEEKKFFESYNSQNFLKNENRNIFIVHYLHSIEESPTFLAGLENELKDFDLVIAIGEESLATFQALKTKRSERYKLILWQTSPRPSTLFYGLANSTLGLPAALPRPQREMTIRQENMKNCDLLICFDKENSTWAYLENVAGQKIRRLTRGIPAHLMDKEFTPTLKNNFRKELGIPENDFIFLHLGPLELEAGALDTLFAFKTMLKTLPANSPSAKLCYCGTGNAGTVIRQTVVQLDLDDHVFFIQPQDEKKNALLGNQLIQLLLLCDTIIHNPLVPVNTHPQKNLDCTWDILHALALRIHIISNGNGWIGEWVCRYFKKFAGGNIHSLAKLMSDIIVRRNKSNIRKDAAFKALKNEFSLERSVHELAEILQNALIQPEQTPSSDKVNISTLIQRIENLQQERQYLDAISLIEKAFSYENLSHFDESHLFRLIGDCFTKLGDFGSGKENYLRAIEKDAFNHKALIGLGTIALQGTDYTIAIPYFQKAVSLAPRDENALLGLALSFEGCGDKKEAYSWTLKAAKANFKNHVVLFNLVKLSYELNTYQEAEDVVATYVKHHPHDVNMIFTLAGLAFKNKKLEQALSLAKNIIGLDPLNARAHSLINEIQNLNCENQSLKA